MSVFIQAYHGGEHIDDTDVCAGDSQKMKAIFWELFEDAEYIEEADTNCVTVTRAQVQDVLQKLEPHPAPLWKDFLTKLLPYDTVALTAR